MTQDKELLLKDLCARLPYGVICQYDTIVPIVGKVKSYDKLRAVSKFDNKPCFQFDCNRDIFDFDNVKPYLFPLSSMTEEQSNELFTYFHNVELKEIETSGDYLKAAYLGENAKRDWLNKNHFDYHYLIEKGLAIDATGLNIY